MLKKLIEIFTDVGDTVIDPCAGSGSTLRASAELGRNSYGFEVEKSFCKEAKEKMLININEDMFIRAELEAKEKERQEKIKAFSQKSIFDIKE